MQWRDSSKVRIFRLIKSVFFLEKELEEKISLFRRSLSKEQVEELKARKFKIFTHEGLRKRLLRLNEA
jgi:hypothetical protein